jgi:hypothetical protein
MMQESDVAGALSPIDAVTGEDTTQAFLEGLALSWRRSGSCIPMHLRSSASLCQVEGCCRLVYANLRTLEGVRSVCLRHFEQLSSLALHVCLTCDHLGRRSLCPIRRRDLRN